MLDFSNCFGGEWNKQFTVHQNLLTYNSLLKMMAMFLLSSYQDEKIEKVQQRKKEIGDNGDASPTSS